VVKAIDTPLYQEFQPAQDLRGFVACTWIRIVHRAEGEFAGAILPDGCADIMLYDDHPPRVAGPDTVTRRVRLQDGLVIAGIRLRPGACRAVLGCPADRLVNGTVQLSDVASGAHRLLWSGTLAGRLSLLENWVRAALTHVAAADRAMIAACGMLAAGARVEVGDVARRLDWNPRMIHRQFVAACGYSPKHFQRIMRIQQALRAAQDAPGIRLCDLAATAGYADQAHMTRDFRAITGFTPAGYFADAAPPGWGTWITEAW
jgi:AraC-like DNA-binding protein